MTMNRGQERDARTRFGARLAGAALLALPAVLAPAGESLAGPTDLTVQYLNYNAATPNDTIAEAGIRIRNNTASAIPLSSIVVRYWFTKNGATSVAPACWWWSPACSNVTLSIGSASATGADSYVEIGFTSGAGSLAAGATTQPIDLGITFGVNTNETDDYSYGNQTSFVDWSKITVHDAGSASTGGLRGGTLPSGSSQPPPGPISAEFFDDFSYSGTSDASFTDLWAVRTWSGGPGVGGAQWLASNVSMVTDPSNGNNKLLRLRGTTNGTGAGTSHAEIMTDDRKFRFGTYATRMKFNNNPLSGTRYYADKPIETFFTITDYIENYLPYSEQDFEYMPNGGWGQGNTSTMWLTSWESTAIKDSDAVAASFDGWHTVLLQITSSTISYYIDGALQTTHDAAYVPEDGQYLSYQVWFDELATGQSSSRTYHIDADWVYFAKDTILSPSQVDAQVAALRSSGLARKDTVP